MEIKLLEGKNALITGGVRGIGLAIAEEFCKNGANVVLTYRSNEEAAEAAEEMLRRYGTRVLVMKGDASDVKHAETAVREMQRKLGSIDILVNNAGITNDKLLIRMSSDDFVNVIQTNLCSAFNFTKYAASAMMKKKSGRIINIASIVGVRGNPGQANYAASKAGIIGMTLSNAKELGKRNITVNAIAPGYIQTDMTAALNEKQRETIEAAITMGKLGEPEDVANLALFLASDRAGYITGQVIGIDGGMII